MKPTNKIKNINAPKNVANQPGASKNNTKKRALEHVDFLQSLDFRSEKFLNLVFLVAFASTFIFTLLTFDLKSSVGGDDSEYVIRAADFVSEFKYPSFQGPLYPMVLSIFVAIAGINLALLKFVSFAFILLHIRLFFKSLQNSIPPFVLVASMLIVGLNAYVLYYASQTYSEAFFLALQMGLFYFLFEKVWKTQNAEIQIQQHWKYHVITGLLLFLLSITKNIAFAAPVALALFYILLKAWKPLAFSLGSFVGFYSLWTGLKLLLWGNSTSQIEAQGGTLLLKHPYDPARGNEDIVGFIERFWNNSGLYLSKHLFAFFGLREEIVDVQNILVFLVYGILILGIIHVFKRNLKVLFIYLYLAVMLGATFLALQTLWDSRRLIIIYFPLIVVAVLSAFYYAGKNKRLAFMQYLLPLIAVVLIFASLQRTILKTKSYSDTISHNLRGDLLYGFSPDWINYIHMSQYAAENVPDSVTIGCRKPSISFVYTNRRFYGMYNLPTLPLDSLKAKLNKLGNNYYIVRAQDWEKVVSMQPYYMKWQTENVGFLTANQKDDKGNSVATYVFEIYTHSADTVLNKLMEKSGLVAANDLTLLEKEFDTVEAQNKGHEVEISVIDPDDLLNKLYENNVQYVVDARLRKFETQKTEYTINTIQRYLFYIQRKYPEKIKLLHRLGDDEEAYLYQIL